MWQILWQPNILTQHICLCVGLGNVLRWTEQITHEELKKKQVVLNKVANY